jgi:cytochrome c peroxidase
MRALAIIIALILASAGALLVGASLERHGASAAVTPHPIPSMAMPPDPSLAERRAAREELGKSLFFDERLSEPAGTSCASCHQPARAFSGNHGSAIGVARGSRTGAFGHRNTPSLTYVSYIPIFTCDREEEPLEPRGGLFLDGRAGSLLEQPTGPLLGAAEMNNTDPTALVAKIDRLYGDQFRATYGPEIFHHGTTRALLAIGDTLAVFESTAAFHPFSSRFDRARSGSLTLDAAEQRGEKLYFDTTKGNCAYCHQARKEFPKATLFFTDFGYETLGVPRNRAIPANAVASFIDLGLGDHPEHLPWKDPSFDGAFRTPSLRNVAVKEAFMHNGAFSLLEDVVAFYATRDTNPARWYPQGVAFDDTRPEDRQYINTGIPFGGKPGDAPHLSPQDIVDLVAFLRALTDREFASALPTPLTVEQVAARMKSAAAAR